MWLFGVLFIAASIVELTVFHDSETTKVLLAYSFVFLVLQQFQTIADEIKLLRTNFVISVRGKIETDRALLSPPGDPSAEKSDAK